MTMPFVRVIERGNPPHHYQAIAVSREFGTTEQPVTASACAPDMNEARGRAIVLLADIEARLRLSVDVQRRSA